MIAETSLNLSTKNGTVNIQSLPNLIFSCPNVTSDANISPEKKQNDFELDDISSRFNTAISYRRDFNFTEFPNAILNFVFILPAWILLISLCFHDSPVFSRLLPENREDKILRKEQTQVWKETSKRRVKIHNEVLIDERALTSTRQRLTKKCYFYKEGQTLVEKFRCEPSVSCRSITSFSRKFYSLTIKHTVVLKFNIKCKPSPASGRCSQTWSRYLRLKYYLIKVECKEIEANHWQKWMSTDFSSPNIDAISSRVEGNRTHFTPTADTSKWQTRTSDQQ